MRHAAQPIRRVPRPPDAATRSTTSRTSDRNFYDRYYFNMHSSSDELFVIIGLGQYPNLGVTDAFITVSIGTEQHTVRASRELGSDRMDTTVGPLGVEVHRGPARSCASRCDDERVGHRAPTSPSPARSTRSRSRARSSAATAACIQDVTRYAQVGVWEGTLTVAGPHLRRHARPLEGRARPLVGRPPGRRARGARASRPARRTDGYGFRHDWLPMQFDDHMLKVQIDQDADGHRHVEESMRVWNIDHGPPGRAPRHARGRHRLPLGHPRDAPARRSRATDPDGDADRRARPRRCARSTSPPARATSPDGKWGHGYYQGPLKVEGHRARPQRPRGAAPVRRPQRDAVPLRDSTPARSATACTRTC